jgi:hypothetical protein
VKFPIVFKQKNEKNQACAFIFFMAEENTNIIPDLTEEEEVRKAIIANEILTRKY